MGFYIIEINDKYKQVVLLSADGELYCKDVAGLMPYTEPDTESIRKEAYQRGLNDAWEAARKIVLDEWDNGIKYDDFYELFNGKSCKQVLNTLTASEAIEKIRQYEQEEKELFLIGDEVEGDEDGRRGVVIDSRFENSQVAVLTGNSKVYSWWSKCAIHKTGRHFPEIAEVLRKMKETE